MIIRLLFHSAAEAVWKEQVDQKFSLYALVKLVENLRRKIRVSGINKPLIHTLRRQGYVLTT